MRCAMCPPPPTAQRSGCASTSCGAKASDGEFAPNIAARIADHPCYSEEAHHYFARMHVAVAPACNIQCNYCNRKFDCANESRPGVVSERLTPEQALRKVIAVANEVPQLSVVGIAGPGDAVYDWARTKRTCELVAAAIPDVKLCLSTNGLALPDHVEEIAALGIDHVTVTVSMVDPDIGAQIYPWVFFNHHRYTGREASEILHERQMLGIERLNALGILIKINSVLIPGVNDAHLATVHDEVTRRGALLHNIMPLISDPAHGTAYGLSGQRGPTRQEMEVVQDACGGARLMRHCRQCRADAVGMLGEDRGQEFNLAELPEDTVYNPSLHETYREFVATERADRATAREAASAEVAAAAPAARLLVAVTTHGGGRVNMHFGKAREFQIYEATARGITFRGVRRVEDQYCQGGWGEDATMAPIVAALEGVDLVLTAKVGDCPQAALAEAGLAVSDAHAEAYIEAAISAAFAEWFGTAAHRRLASA